jgi:hypothetical protein
MDKFGMESLNHQVGNTLNPTPPEGFDPTADALEHQLQREQHDFYTQQQYGSAPTGGDLSWEGIKHAAFAVAVILALGFFFKYIV